MTILIILLSFLTLALVLASISMVIYVNFTKKYYTEQEIEQPIIYFIKTVDNNIIINCENIKNIKQGYSNIDKEYQIVIKTDTDTIIESFSTAEACQERFEEIYEILNIN